MRREGGFRQDFIKSEILDDILAASNEIANLTLARH